MATADNLKIAQQLLATMQQITVQADQQTKAYQAQADLVDALCKAQECYSKLDTNKTKELADSMNQAGAKTKSFSESIKEAAEKGDVLATKIKGVTDKLKKLAVPAEFLNGFKAGINFSNNLIKGLMKLGGPVLGLMKDLGSILLSIPGKVMEFFQNAHNGAISPFTIALEEVRKEFGNLEIGTSAAIVGMTKSIRDLGESGLRLGQVFGFGPEGMAKLLQENMEIAKGMGPVFTQFSQSLKGAFVDFTLLRKATNLSAESFKSMYLSAQESGISTGQAIKEMSKDLARAERAFGITAKEYGRDIDYMMKETATFGVMAPKEMLKVSTYVRKLGVSMETLKKVIDKSLNFEDAAQQTAKLSEAFNIQIDAMKLMNASPTEKIDLIRKGFSEAGHNIEQMSVLQKRFIAEQTGMSEEEMRFAFAQKNRAMTGAQIDAQMKKAQKTPISQAEAMQTLAKSIERVFKEMQTLKGGFTDMFMKGFFGGIERTKAFRDVTRALQGAMREVLYAGRQVGRMFVELFPGIKDILVGFRDLFSPSKFRDLMTKVVKEFRDFFTLLKTDPQAGFQNFMKNMKKIFFDFFSKESPAGSKVLDGIKTFFKTMGILFVQGIKYSLTAMKDMLVTIVAYVKDPSSLTKTAGDVGGGLAGMFKQAFIYMIKELGPVMKEVGKAFADLLKVLYEQHIKPHITKILLKGLAIYLAPAIIVGLTRGLIAGLFSSKEGVESGFSKLQSMISKITGKKGGKKGEEAEKDPNKAAKDAEKQAGGLMQVAKSVGMFTIAISTVIAAIILLAALYETANVKPESLLVMVVTFAAVSALFLGILKSKLIESTMELGSKIKGGKELGDLAKGLGAIGLLLLAVGAIAAIGSLVFDQINPESVKTFLLAVSGTTVLFYAMAGLLVVAALLGAAASGPQVGFALVGLAAMGVLLAAIVAFAEESIVSFTNAMDKAKITPDKVEMVTGTLETFVDMVVKLSAAIAMLSLSAPFAALGGVISKLFGTTNPFEALNDVLKIVSDSFLSIIPSLEKMTGDPTILKTKADIFNSIASGLTGLIVPVTKVMDSLSGGVFSSLNTGVVEAAGDAIVDLISVLAEPKRGVIPSIMAQLTEMASSDIEPTKLKAMAEVFSAVTGGLAQILTAVSGMIEQFSVGSMAGFSSAGAIIQALSLAAKLKALTEVTKQLLPALKDAIVSMVRDIKDVAETITNVEGMKAVAPIIGAISTALSSMLTAISKLMDRDGVSGAIDSLGNLISGRSAASISDERLNQVQTFVAVVTGSIKRFVSDLIEKIKDLADHIPTEETKIKGFQVITDLIKSVVSMFGPFLSAISSIVEVSTRNVKTIPGLNAMGEFVRELISRLTFAMTSLFDNLPPLIERIMSIPIQPGLAAKVNSLKGVFDIVSSVANIVSSLKTNTGGNTSRALNPFYEVFQPVMTILEHMFVIPFHSARLQAVINALAGKGFAKLEGIGGRAKNIKSVFEMVKSVAEATKAISDLGGGKIDPTIGNKVTAALSNMGSVLNALVDPELGGTGINPLMDFGLTGILGMIHANLQRMEPRVKGIGAKLASMNDTANRLSSIRFVGLEHIKEMVKAYNEFSVELSNINTAGGNTGPIEVAVRKLNTKLQGARAATIQNAAVRAQINVLVRMEAGELVKTLHTHAVQQGENVGAGRPFRPAFDVSAFNTNTFPTD